MLPPPARRLGPPTFFTNSMERKPSQVKEEGKKKLCPLLLCCGNSFCFFAYNLQKRYVVCTRNISTNLIWKYISENKENVKIVTYLKNKMSMMKVRKKIHCTYLSVRFLWVSQNVFASLKVFFWSTMFVKFHAG